MVFYILHFGRLWVNARAILPGIVHSIRINLQFKCSIQSLTLAREIPYYGEKMTAKIFCVEQIEQLITAYL